MKLVEYLKVRNVTGRALAAHLGVSQPTVSDWATGKKRVPLDRCPYIEQFTGGAVSCEELRPDQIEYFALLRERAAPLVGEGANA